MRKVRREAVGRRETTESEDVRDDGPLRLSADGLFGDRPIQLLDSVAHCLPREAFPLFEAVLSESLQGIAFVDAFDGPGDPLDGRRSDVSHPAVGNDFGQPPDVGYDHRCTELIGDLGYAALGGAFVGLYDAIRSRKIVSPLRFSVRNSYVP